MSPFSKEMRDETVPCCTSSDVGDGVRIERIGSSSQPAIYSDQSSALMRGESHQRFRCQGFLSRACQTRGATCYRSRKGGSFGASSRGSAQPMCELGSRSVVLLRRELRQGVLWFKWLQHHLPDLASSAGNHPTSRRNHGWIIGFQQDMVTAKSHRRRCSRDFS